VLVLMAGCVPSQPAPPSVVLPRIRTPEMAELPPQTPRLLIAPFAVADRSRQVAVRGRPTGVLLLSDKNLARNRLLCAAPDEDIRPPQHPRDVKLYILDRRKPATRAPSESCDELLANYDYYRAQKNAAQYGLEVAVGPVLIEYSGSRSKDLVWDLSKLPEADVPRAIAIWQRGIAPDSEIWRQGWRVALVDSTVTELFHSAYGGQLAANQLPVAVERKPLVGLAPPPARADAKPPREKVRLSEASDRR
jgi:hypothetical protein